MMNAAQEIVTVDAPRVPAAQPSNLADPLAIVARLAENPNVDPDKLVKLYELAERARAARAKEAFAADFAAMIPNLPSIDRRGCIVVYSKADREKAGGPRQDDRPQQVTPYATFDDILAGVVPVLSAHRFSIRFEHITVPAGDSYRIATKAILTHGEGHSESAETPPLLQDSSGSKNTVQAVGSSLAYGKRYALRAILPIVSHAPQDRDDDGKAAGDPATIDPDQIADIETRLRDTGSDVPKFLEWIEAESVEAMTIAKYKKAVAMLADKARRMSK
jgi:hypothetical protein